MPLGPVGCPPVAEFAPQGLVGPFDASTQSVRSWMADALTIRHRLPRLWERVVAGDVHHWKARQIATLTAHLGVAAAAEVDQQTAAWVEQLPWPTFLKALDATMLQVDESTYRERERLAAAKREVRATPSEAGLRTLIARGEAGDVTMMLALYQRVAECLADDGDEDPLPVRMSKAIGIIANPARLTDLLARHADDPDPHQQPWEKVAAHQNDPTDPCVRRPPTSRLGNLPAQQLPPTRTGRRRVVGPIRGTTTRKVRTKEPTHRRNCEPDRDDLAWYECNQLPTETDRVADTAQQHPTTPPPRCRNGGRRRSGTPAGDRSHRPSSRPAHPTVVMHVHLTDETLRTGHGVVRTDTGPITLEQLHRFLIQHDAKITIRPVTDPAATAAADAVTRSPSGSAAPWPSGTHDRCSRTHPRPAAASTSTTPPRTTRKDHPVRPGCTTSAPWPAANTEPRPSETGEPDNPNPAPTSGDQPTAGS